MRSSESDADAIVEGVGWIRRDRPDAIGLQATLPTLHAFVLEDLSAHLAAPRGVCAAGEILTIERAIATGTSLLSARNAFLVHGDLDATHIYHREGEYTGIIDFGEIRGADPMYDLGHFALHDGETIPRRVLPSLLAGYSDVTPLPPDAGPRIGLWSLLIGVHTLARSIGRPQSAYQDHLVSALRRVLTELSA